jgi:hypothetical protein
MARRDGRYLLGRLDLELLRLDSAESDMGRVCEMISGNSHARPAPTRAKVWINARDDGLLRASRHLRQN